MGNPKELAGPAGSTPFSPPQSMVSANVAMAARNVPAEVQFAL